MAKRTKASTTVIQNLLEEKRQIERWLRRLDMAGDKTPPGVRDKVRSDYGKRRDAILAELQGHRDALNSALTEHRANRDALASAEEEATERLAEAELRHTVGEYDASKWTEIRAEISEELVKVREELESAQAEISQLEEVLDAIERPDAGPTEPEEPAEPAPAKRPRPRERPAAPPEPEPEVEAEAEEAEEPVVAELEDEEDEAPAVPERKPKSAEAPGKSADELAFLRSVISSDDATSNLKGKAGVAATAQDEDDEPRRPAPKGSAKKTVKCTDCGTLNLPTEWYCEMCGAELTAL
jgi:hypothetical protein